MSKLHLKLVFTQKLSNNLPCQVDNINIYDIVDCISICTASLRLLILLNTVSDTKLADSRGPTALAA